MRIGVLALQGDFREHQEIVLSLGHEAPSIRRSEELSGLDGLIIPGGESTTIALLAKNFDLINPIRQAIATGLPVYGSCAGMILLSDHIIDGAPNQETFGGIDMVVKRNAFGRQVDSFEGEIDFNGSNVHGVFIRAPWVESVGSAVQVLAEFSGHPVAVRQGNLLATSFHPELTNNSLVHRYFFDEMCR
jgi:pyridoxal 5'-phosphate synthase pdxT subunit